MKYMQKRCFRAVVQSDLQNKKIKKWDSISEAARVLKIPDYSITNCLLGRSKSSLGYKWRYV